MLFPKLWKPRKYTYKRRNTSQAAYTAKTYNYAPVVKGIRTGKTKPQKDDFTLSCIVSLIAAIAFLTLIGCVFGWIWVACIVSGALVAIFFNK